MEDFQLRAEEIWKSAAVGYLLCVVGALAACWALYSIPLPGISIAILGAVAAVMSLRPEMRSPEKAFWAIVVSLLLLSELHAIRIDRKNADAQALKDRRDQDDAFASIREREDRSLKETLKGFKTDSESAQRILDKTEKVSRLTQRNLEEITGGKSFLVLRAMGIKAGYFSPFIFSVGNTIVRRAQARIVNVARFYEDAQAGSIQEVMAHDIDINIGDMAPHQSTVLLSRKIELGSTTFVAFNIFFDGLNGFWTEELRLRKKGDDWLQAVKILRSPIEGRLAEAGDVVYQQIDKGFVEPGKEMDWDHPS